MSLKKVKIKDNKEKKIEFNEKKSLQLEISYKKL